MISEVFFANNYNFFWNELLPGRSDYVRNHVNKYDIDKNGKDKNANLKRLYPLTEVEEVPDRRDLINEVSFFIFKKYCENKSQKMNEINFRQAFSKEIHDNELPVIEALSKRLTDTFSKKEELDVSPMFKGCGLIDEARGDVYYKDTLVEIKARGYRKYKVKSDFFEFLKDETIGGDVIDKLQNLKNKSYKTIDELAGSMKGIIGQDMSIQYKETISKYFNLKKGCNFKGTDLQQLLVYGALNYIQGRGRQTREIKKFQLFNPRLGFLWEADVEEVAQNLGGCSSTDIYNEIINFISSEYRSL